MLDEKCIDKSICIPAVKITELEKRMEMMVETAKEAVKLAANDLKVRLDNMNEFRQTLRDQAGTFMTRNEGEQRFISIEKDIKQLELAKATLEGKASQQSVSLAYLIAIISLILSAINIFMK